MDTHTSFIMIVDVDGLFASSDNYLFKLYLYSSNHYPGFTNIDEVLNSILDENSIYTPMPYPKIHPHLNGDPSPKDLSVNGLSTWYVQKATLESRTLPETLHLNTFITRGFITEFIRNGIYKTGDLHLFRSSTQFKNPLMLDQRVHPLDFVPLTDIADMVETLYDINTIKESHPKGFKYFHLTPKQS